MNNLRGTITQIDTEDNLSIFGIDIGGEELHAVVIENDSSADWLKPGKPVDALFKETQVIILRDAGELSRMLNTLRCEVVEISEKEIFSRISIQYKTSELHAVVATKLVKTLDLKVGESILIHLQPNEIMISPC